MKFFVVIIFLILFSPLPIMAQEDYGHKPGFNLVWHDEFQDSVRTFSQWDRNFPWGPMNCEKSVSVRYGNHQFEGGKLNLLNQQKKVTELMYAWDSNGVFQPYMKDFDYTYAMLYSKDQFLHGYFEVGFQSDPGKGFYNAFWLYGEKACEIDVFELSGSDPYDAQMTLHWKEKDPITNSSQSITHLKANKHFGETQHKFGVLWTSSQLSWFHNGTEVPQTAWVKSVRRRHIPDVPMNMIVNSAIACFDGEPNSSTQLPGKISFDFARAYQNEKIVKAPEIIGQNQLFYKTYDNHYLDQRALQVIDFYETYPYGFKYEILNGTNYSTDGLRFKVDSNYSGDLELNVRVHDGINYSSVYKVLVKPDIELGLNDLISSTNVRIYPNPANGYVIIEKDFDAIATVEVRSVEGKLVYSSQLSESTSTIALDEITRGLYFVVVSLNGGSSFQQRLVVQ